MLLPDFFLSTFRRHLRINTEMTNAHITMYADCPASSGRCLRRENGNVSLAGFPVGLFVCLLVSPTMHHRLPFPLETRPDLTPCQPISCQNEMDSPNVQAKSSALSTTDRSAYKLGFHWGDFTKL